MSCSDQNQSDIVLDSPTSADLYSASLAALTTSCINIIVLTLLHGKELGWVCLASCGSDVSEYSIHQSYDV